MILYVFPISIFSQKAMMACEEKALDYVLREVNPLEPGPDAEHLAQLSPWARVPILISDDQTVVLESSIIAEYVDKRVANGVRLLPEDPAACLHVRYVDRVLEMYFLAALRRIFYASRKPEDRSSQAMLTRAHEQLDETYIWLNQELKEREWVAGDTFSLADCSLGVALNRASLVYPFDRYKSITAYADRIFQRPSLKTVLSVARQYATRNDFDVRAKANFA